MFQKFMVENSRVENFLVEKSKASLGLKVLVEKSGLEMSFHCQLDVLKVRLSQNGFMK